MRYSSSVLFVFCYPFCTFRSSWCFSPLSVASVSGTFYGATFDISADVSVSIDVGGSSLSVGIIFRPLPTLKLPDFPFPPLSPAGLGMVRVKCEDVDSFLVSILDTDFVWSLMSMVMFVAGIINIIVGRRA